MLDLVSKELFHLSMPFVLHVQLCSSPFSIDVSAVQSCSRRLHERALWFSAKSSRALHSSMSPQIQYNRFYDDIPWNTILGVAHLFAFDFDSVSALTNRWFSPCAFFSTFSSVFDSIDIFCSKAMDRSETLPLSWSANFVSAILSGEIKLF